MPTYYVEFLEFVGYRPTIIRPYCRSCHAV